MERCAAYSVEDEGQAVLHRGYNARCVKGKEFTQHEDCQSSFASYLFAGLIG